MAPDHPIAEIADRARAACNRLLRKHRLADRRRLHDRCVALDRRALLDTPVAEARYVVLDTETTGLAAYAGDRIVQLALLEYRGLQPTGEELCSLVRPGIPIPARATDIHGIDDDMVVGAPTIEELIDEVVAFLDGAVLVGHHVAFDLRFLNRVTQRTLFCRLPHPTLDTMLMYLARSGRLGHYGLGEIAEACGVPVAGRHDARGDALMCGRVFARLAAPAAAAGATVGDLAASARQAPARSAEPAPPA